MQKKLATLQTGRSWRVNMRWLIGGLLGLTLIVAVIRALPETGGLVWLFVVPALPQAVGDLATVLAPLLAVAVAVERLLETAFDSFEQSTRAVADVLKAGKDTLDWTGLEYQTAYEAVVQAANTVASTLTPDADTVKKFEAAEQRLAKAESRLRSWTSSPEYLAWKRALSVWFGLLAGLMVAVLGDLSMLHLIGIPAPRLLDMIVTGLVIGAGPGPMHSLIGILQSGKDALANLSDVAKGKAISEAVDAAKKSTQI